jgi:hypothetical protein
MGTRNLTKVIDKDGVIRVAQYGQWDGYPSYSGIRMLSFISESGMLDKIEKSLSKCRFGSKEEVDATYAVYNESELKDDFGGFSILFPSLSRDTGVDILKTIVYSNSDILLWNDEEFENDDLFCEGVYTLDFKQRLFISKYNGAILIHEFDRLPTEEEYLSAWKALTPTP